MDVLVNIGLITVVIFILAVLSHLWKIRPTLPSADEEKLVAHNQVKMIAVDKANAQNLVDKYGRITYIVSDFDGTRFFAPSIEAAERMASVRPGTIVGARIPDGVVYMAAGYPAGATMYVNPTTFKNVVRLVINCPKRNGDCGGAEDLRTYSVPTIKNAIPTKILIEAQTLLAVYPNRVIAYDDGQSTVNVCNGKPWNAKLC